MPPVQFISVVVLVVHLFFGVEVVMIFVATKVDIEPIHDAISLINWETEAHNRTQLGRLQCRIVIPREVKGYFLRLFPVHLAAEPENRLFRLLESDNLHLADQHGEGPL